MFAVYRNYGDGSPMELIVRVESEESANATAAVLTGAFRYQHVVVPLTSEPSPEPVPEDTRDDEEISAIDDLWSQFRESLKEAPPEPEVVERMPKLGRPEGETFAGMLDVRIKGLDIELIVGDEESKVSCLIGSEHVGTLIHGLVHALRVIHLRRLFGDHEEDTD